MQNRFPIIFLFCGFLVWFGCAVNNRALNQIQKGHEFFAEQRYDEAIGAYQQALKQAPNSINVFNYVGLTYAAQQRWNKAIAAYQEALKINPNIPEVYVNLGFAYQQLKRLDDAIVAWAKYRKRERSRPCSY